MEGERTGMVGMKRNKDKPAQVRKTKEIKGERERMKDSRMKRMQR